MKLQKLLSILLITNSFWMLFINPATAETVEGISKRKIRQLSEIELPITSAQKLVQTPTPTNSPNPDPPYQGGKQGGVVQVTGVKANPTDKGVEVILQTSQGEQLKTINRSTGNNFIADIPNAQLRLPNGEAFTFRSDKPIAGITEITVINFDANTIRVTVTGEASVPTVELFDSDEGLIFGLTPTGTATQNPTPPTAPLPLPRGGEGEGSEPPTSETPQNEPIELMVTGEQDGYSVPDASTATRTDTPLRDIPQSIQVIPNQVIRDQGVNRLQDAVRNNAPGVSQLYPQNQNFVIRGFRQDFNLRNGFRTSSGFAPIDVDLADIERIEVLRGPASVLFGQLQPGGVINTVTKQPLSEPYHNIQFTGGQFSFYRPEFDFSGPLSDDGTVRYRLNTAYQNNGSFRDFVSEERFFIAPVLQWKISENTILTVDFSYTYNDPVLDFGVVALSDGSLVLPTNRALFYPSIDEFIEEQYQAGYRLEHNFSDNWRLRNGFSYSGRRESGGYTYIEARPLREDRFIDKIYADGSFRLEDFQMQTDLIGKFATGSIQHQLLIGFDLSRATSYFTFGTAPLPTIDIFNPDYNVTRPDVQIEDFGTTFTDSLGIYIQDQIDITDNLHVLVGGRFDFTKQFDSFDTFSQSDQAFSPRVGIVYQPVEPISLYASYSQSFNPVIGRSRTNTAFKPERGTQYELGIKADITNTLSTTLAAFEITKSNVLTTDPADPIFSIQVGEQRSRGIEFTLQGEILPGWNIIAGYAYTDARVTEDNRIPEGDFLPSVPKNAANLWTTYEIQSGDFRGLGLGFGLVFVGERQGDFPNSNFQNPSYVRTDAALFYRRDNWRTAININNLFGVEYYEVATNRSRVYPGAPFNVQATISYEF
ncbi:TonB-dependent siderophore receptor [Chlorogloeopsis sp. ULAP01]|uniref:TonB-dependent siderophore receptor n=1 Tax=Chlorogloeopsis sp. ULAP01 TaxID=3056483 RepID=UPI0025AAE136|nr:TonB-dependent siderophore receptor [Chlorogloeopsis sp. ULAP01]MDM9385277.1 TonB-dependent siderophore receptor [Chlorogloeopsis sp. ULAP01]